MERIGVTLSRFTSYVIAVFLLFMNTRYKTKEFHFNQQGITINDKVKLIKTK